MKRYRVHVFDFDSRPYFLSLEIKDEWEEKVKKSHLENREKLLNDLKLQFGNGAFKQKKENFIALESMPVSLIAFHNKFLHQIRDSFVVGGYYPALTAACVLGERILNRLILSLRDDYSTTPGYKKVYDKDSFDDWNVAINVLIEWNVLQPDAADGFRNLMIVRNQAIHFKPDVDKNDRELALKSIKLLHKVIEKQFSSFGPMPWYITKIPGECYIKKDWEANPFVKKICIPNCIYVGPKHKIGVENNQFIAYDVDTYEDKKISDEEFIELRNKFKSKQV